MITLIADGQIISPMVSVFPPVTLFGQLNIIEIFKKESLNPTTTNITNNSLINDFISLDLLVPNNNLVND